MASIILVELFPTLFGVFCDDGVELLVCSRLEPDSKILVDSLEILKQLSSLEIATIRLIQKEEGRTVVLPSLMSSWSNHRHTPAEASCQCQGKT